jgi:uncharacterized membrane protein
VRGIIGAFVRTAVRFLFTGIATLLPFVVTIFVITWVVRIADVYIGPSSYFGALVQKLSGPHRVYAGYLVGYVVSILLIMLLGFLVTRATVARLHQGVDAVFTKIPLFGKVYAAVGQIVELFNKKNGGGLDRFLGIVQFKAGNVKMLGLLSSSERFVLRDGQEYVLIFVPNSPIPATGFNMMVPVEDVQILDMPVEDLAKLMMSLGILGSQVLKEPIAKTLSKEGQESVEEIVGRTG